MFSKRTVADLPPCPRGGLWAILEVEASCGSRLFEGGRLHETSRQGRRFLEGGENPGDWPAAGHRIGLSGSEALAAAQGSAMSGRRSSALLHGGLEASLPALQLAARRQVPLVVHVTGMPDHTAYHTVAESGCFLLMSEDAQQSADLTLLAHRLSEQSLVPAVLVHDWLAADAGERNGDGLDLPSLSLVRRYLGEEDDSIESPCEAQFQIFGEYRRRLPRWIDRDHPTAWPDRSLEVAAPPECSASLRNGPRRNEPQSNHNAAQAGREVFFRQQVADLASKAMRDFGRETGRPLSPLRTYEIENADQVLVAQGAAFHCACRVARRLCRNGSAKVGVLGLTWLRPFPSSEMGEALSRRPALTVLERVPLLYSGQAPLGREMSAALGTWKETWITAHLPSHSPSGRQEEQGQTSAWEGARSRGGNAQPEGRASQEPLSSQEKAVDQGQTRTGPGRADSEQFMEAQLVTLLDEQRNRPGSRSRVVLGLPGGPGESPFPKRESLLAAVGNAYPQLRTLTLQQAGRDAAGRSRLPDASRMTASPMGQEPEIPALVRRMGAGRHGFHNLATFWGDVAQPLREGRFEGFPDPLATLGAVPSSSAALAPAVEGDVLPLLDPAKCSGCGHCWTLCPDSAVSATVTGLRAWIDQAIKPLAKHPGGSSLRRVMGQWTAALSSRLRQGRALDADLVMESYLEAAPDKRNPQSDASKDGKPRVLHEEASDLLRALRGALQEATAVPAIHTKRFFQEPESRKAGQGTLLFLGFNPSTCRACRACIEECPEGALTAGPRDGAAIRQTAAAWNCLESLPDTPGAIIAETLRQAETEDAQASQPGNAGGLEADDSAPQNRFQQEIQSTGKDGPPKGETAQAAGLSQDTRPQGASLHPGQTSSPERPYPQWTRLASMLLSRHCAQAQLGGGHSEPGSGSRLAGRLVAGVAEYAGQQRATRRVRRLQELTGQVHDRLHKLLSAGLDAADPALLESVLGELDESETRLSRLDEALAKRGRSIRLDRDKIADLAHLERRLQDDSWRLEEGPSRLGRARFQVVAAGPSAAQWAARYPWHPYHAPLLADLSEQGLDLALGLAESSAIQAVEEASLLRSASLRALDPPDLKDRLRRLAHLTWQDLDDDERSASAPILLFTDPETLAAHSLASISRLMTASYPVKVILFNRHPGHLGSLVDDGASSLAASWPHVAGPHARSERRRAGSPKPREAQILRPPGPDAASPWCLSQAMFFPQAFLLSSTPAHAAHLCQGLEAALDYPGPALIDLYAPSPSADGFPSSDTLQRARGAVEARVHPLVKRDPRGQGLLGSKITLQGNPAPGQDWGCLTLSDWARGEERLAGLDAAQVESLTRIFQQRWKTLLEVAGVESPFVERIRHQLHQEKQQELRLSEEQLQSQYEDRRNRDEQSFQQQVSQSLRRRLRQLAGIDA